MGEKMYSVGEFAKKLNRTVATLQRWDREGRLKAFRTLTGRRYYTELQFNEMFGVSPKEGDKKVYVYSRVSSNSQKPDLINQVKALEHFCVGRGLVVDCWVSEVGSALNYNRPKFNSLLGDIEKGLVRTLVIAHKDRFVRFGWSWFQRFIEEHGCELIVVNQESLSPQEEVVEDLMTIVHCFSSRLYGLRAYKSKIKEVVTGDNRL